MLNHNKRFLAVSLFVASAIIQASGCVAAGIGLCFLLHLERSPFNACLFSVLSAIVWFIVMPIAVWRLMPRKVIPDESPLSSDLTSE